MIMSIRHYASFLRKRRLHQLICKCRGRGFRYHILHLYH